MMLALRDFLICVPATIFFAVLFHVPRRAIIISAVLGGAGYAVFDLVQPGLHSAIAGYFVGTLFMAACSEILARVMKMPVTVFVIPAIIPLVPGLGLYNTMKYLVDGQNSLAAQTGSATILDIVAMAMAMALTTILSRSLSDLHVRMIRRRETVKKF